MNLFLKTFNFTMGFIMCLSIMYTGKNLLPETPAEEFVLEAVILPPGAPSSWMEVCESKSRVTLTDANQVLSAGAFEKCQSVEVVMTENETLNVRFEDLPRIPTLQEI